MLDQPEDPDSYEVFKDIKEVEQLEEESSAAEEEEEEKPAKANKSSTTYDSRSRNPVFANAQTTCLWELVSISFR